MIILLICTILYLSIISNTYLILWFTCLSFRSYLIYILKLIDFIFFLLLLLQLRYIPKDLKYSSLNGRVTLQKRFSHHIFPVMTIININYTHMYILSMTKYNRPSKCNDALTIHINFFF